jgi:hypothetical protein
VNKKIKTILLLFLIYLSCGIKKDVNKCIEIENLDSFYYTFHNDSSFQFTRIIFPIRTNIISSVDYNPDSSLVDTLIYKENWLLQSIPSFDSIIYKEEKIITDSNFIHRIFIPNSGFEIKRVFKLIDCKWYLVYYSDIDL